MLTTVGVSFTTLDGPLWWNFILTCFSGGIVSPVCAIRSGETFVLLVSAARQWWKFTTCWIGKLWSKNSFCWCPVRKLFYCSSLLRSVVFLRKRKRNRVIMNALKSLLHLVGLSKSDVFFIHSIIPLINKKIYKNKMDP